MAKGRKLAGALGLALAIVAVAPTRAAAPGLDEPAVADDGVVWAGSKPDRKSAFGAGLFVIVSDWRFKRGSGFARHERT